MYISLEINRSYTISEDDICIPFGEITGDNSVDIVDIVAMVAEFMGNMEFNQIQDCQADLNLDNVIDVSDVVLIVGSIL